MKKIIIFVVLILSSFVSSSIAGSFYIREGTVLRNNVDATLMNYNGSKARVTDSRGTVFRIQFYSWSGNCREAIVYAPNGDMAQATICRRKSQRTSYGQIQHASHHGYRQQQGQGRSIEQQILTQGYARSMQSVTVGPQYALRGHENAPYQNRVRTNVNHNRLFDDNMTPAQEDRYMAKMDWIRKDEEYTISNNKAAAEAADAWTRDQLQQQKLVYQQNIERAQGWVNALGDLVYIFH